MKKIILLFALVLFYTFCMNKNKKSEGELIVNKKHNGPVAVFKWGTESSINVGTYDPQKYSVQEIKNTYALWFPYFGYHLEKDPPFEHIEDIEKIDIKKLTREYNFKKALVSRKVVPFPYWHKLRLLRLQELKNEYELNKITMMAYSDPSVLLHNKYSSCLPYAKALVSKDTTVLLNVWRDLAEMRKSQGKSVDSTNRLLYVRMILLKQWFDCAKGSKTSWGDNVHEYQFDTIFISIKKKSTDVY